MDVKVGEASADYASRGVDDAGIRTGLEIEALTADYAVPDQNVGTATF